MKKFIIILCILYAFALGGCNRPPQLEMPNKTYADGTGYKIQLQSKFYIKLVEINTLSSIDIITNREGEAILTKNNTEFEIEEIPSDILKISYSVGSYAQESLFYDLNRKIMSETYPSPIAYGYNKVVYMERDNTAPPKQKNQIIVQDIFDSHAFKKTITRNFANYSDADLIGEFINSNQLKITYYIGEDRTEGLLKTTEIIDLSATQ